MGFKKKLVKASAVLVGAFILAFGLYNIHSRCDITEGGVLGGVLLLEHWFGISPSVTGLLLDGACYLVGFKYLGKAFAGYSVLASAGFSLSYRFVEKTGPLLPDLSAMPLLAALLGGIFVGVGVGICVRQGGAAGGDDALAMTISKMSGIDISKAYLFTDLVVLGLSLSYIPMRKIACSLVTVTVSSWLIGKMQRMDMGRKRKAGKI